MFSMTLGGADSYVDQDWVQLSEAAVHRRVQSIPCVLQLGRRSALVSSPFHIQLTHLLLFICSAYLESLCDYLYDDLRPRILHEPRLTALCEVCTVLQALMVLDVPAIGDEEDEEDYTYADELNLDLRGEGRRPGKRGLRSLHVGYLLQMVLQDAQTQIGRAHV